VARTLKQENTERILHEKPLIKGLILLSIPVFLNNLLKSLHDMIDAIFVARMPGYSESTIDAALVSLNIHWPINGVLLALGTGLGIATVSIVSQYVGANRRDLAQKYASKLVILGIILALIVFFIYFFTSDRVLGYNLLAHIMGARGEALFFAGQYFRIRSYEVVFVFIFIIYQAIRQATGETLKPVLLNTGAIILNIFLTYLFVSKFEMGVAGAGYSTLIAQGIMIPFIIFDLFFSKKHLNISLKHMGIDLKTVKDMSRFAVPATLGQAISSLGFVFIQSAVLRYGDQVSAGFSVGNRISSLLLNPVVAVSTILAAYVGLNIGHNQPERAKESYRVARNLSFGIMVVGVISFILFRRSIVALVLGTTTTTSYDIAVEYTLWLLLTQPFMALFQCYIGLFNGSGHSKFTLRLSIIRLWFLRIPMILIFMWILPKDNYSGIWWAMILSNIIILFFGHKLKNEVKFELQVKMDV